MEYKNSLDNFEMLLNDVRKKLIDKIEGIENEIVNKDKWSKKEILGHLIDSCENNRQRIIRLESNGNNFFSHYNQDEWVSKQGYYNMNARIIIEKLYYSNLHLICLFNNLSSIKDEIFIFSNDSKSSIRAILDSYLNHFNHHISQI